MCDSSISIIVPAYNEEACIAATLDAIGKAVECAVRKASLATEIIVVNNGSSDRTAEIARIKGATVVEEPRRNVAGARNAGARVANGQTFVFVDADTIWPERTLSCIVEMMSNDKCLGGAVDTEYRPKRRLIRAYLQFWRVVGNATKMAQGATQSCAAHIFRTVHGYDETVFMGEDVDFYWRIGKAARAEGCGLELIDDVRVLPSCRRFDQWPVWKTLLLTNPLTCMLFSRRKRPRDGWYGQPTR